MIRYYIDKYKDSESLKINYEFSEEEFKDLVYFIDDYTSYKPTVVPMKKLIELGRKLKELI